MAKNLVQRFLRWRNAKAFFYGKNVFKRMEIILKNKAIFFPEWKKIALYFNIISILLNTFSHQIPAFFVLQDPPFLLNGFIS